MSKRSASSELNHDNWNQEEEPEDPGTFKTLTPSQLEGRVFAKAKRSLGSSNSSGNSPFAAFSGFSSSSSLKPFSFLQQKDESEPDSKSVQKNENGNSLPAVDIKSEAANQKKSISQTIFGNKLLETNLKTSEGKENGSSSVTDAKKTDQSPENTTSSFSATKDKPKRNPEYYKQLKSLNESVLNWIQLHFSKNAWCDFTPVFNDYKKHMDSLNVTFPIKKKEIESDSAFKNSKENSNNSENASSTFLPTNFSKDETDYGAHFSSNTTNTSTFSYGNKTIPTITSSGATGPTSSFKVESADEKKSSSQFSFGLNKGDSTDQQPANKSFSFAVSGPVKTSEEGADEDAEYVPPKSHFQAVTEEDSFYSKRCKLYFKKDEAYVEKGIGTLHLKPLNGKTQLLIRAETNLGNILLNIMLSASLPMSRSGKNNVLMVCIPNPPVDVKDTNSKVAIPMLIRLKTAEDADELLEKLNEHKS